MSSAGSWQPSTSWSQKSEKPPPASAFSSVSIALFLARRHGVWSVGGVSQLDTAQQAQLHFGLNGTVLSNGMHEPGSPAHGAAAALRSPVSFRTGRHLQSSAAAPDVRRGNIAGRRPSLQMCTVHKPRAGTCVPSSTQRLRDVDRHFGSATSETDALTDRVWSWRRVHGNARPRPACS